MTLSDLDVNQQAIIKALPSNESVAQQLIEYGFLPNSQVTLAHKALWRGPVAVKIDNFKVSIAQQLAKQIAVEKI